MCYRTNNVWLCASLTLLKLLLNTVALSVQSVWMPAFNQLLHGTPLLLTQSTPAVRDAVDGLAPLSITLG